ncbi:MAG: histidinol-phosphate aminotransferase [Actinomycetota bacterium]|nr:histidinol-phosphate aminotransferase [Actinomycetota bacterium]
MPAATSCDPTPRLPIRPDLVGRVPYGAPQLDVPVRLNTNENSHPVPPDVAAAITAALAQAVPGLNRYPDREFTALRQALAHYLGHDLRAEQLWAGNGSNEVLQHILQAFGGPGRTAMGFTPAYSLHPLIASGTSTAWIDGLRGQGPEAPPRPQGPPRPEAPRRPQTPGSLGAFELTAQAAVRQIERADPDLVFLCSPNNPTGTALDLEVVRAVLECTRGIVVVDEAYTEFARPGTPSALTLLPGRARLIVTRTMSKAFALAGARLGYLAADPAVCDALRLVRLPYHLSSLTQVAAQVALAHAPRLLAGVRSLIEQRDRIVAGATSLGLSPEPSDANFVLIGGLTDERRTFEHLLDAGVLVRDVGLAHHLRVTAGTEEETTAFLDALASSLQEDR